MVVLALTLSCLTSTWTYPGFVANPSSPPPPPPAAAVSIPRSPLPPRPAPVAAVICYRMADATGQVWEHLDPQVLRAFVLERNARLVRPLYVTRRVRFRR